MSGRPTLASLVAGVTSLFGLACLALALIEGLLGFRLIRDNVLFVAFALTGGFSAAFLFRMIEARQEQLFSLDLAFVFGLFFFYFGLATLTFFDSLLGFGLDAPGVFVQIMLEWGAKGSFFDILESFDVQLQGTEAKKNKPLFDLVEFVFRTLWGLWSAYLFATIFVKVRDLVACRAK